MWEVEVTDQFRDWWGQLSVEQQEALTDRVDLLAERGPDLGRPVVDRIVSSRHQNMKGLRAAKDGALRVLFVFDPRRTANLLLGGDRAGSGRAATAGRCPRPTTCTTNTWPNCARKD